MDYRDLLNPATFADEPYLHELTAHMRSHDPLPFIETDTYKPLWVCTKHADILEVERQHTKFLNTARSVLQSREIEAQEGEQGPRLRTLINMDEPDHQAFRDLTKDWFMPNNIRKVEGRVQAIAKAAVDRMLEMGPEIDFVRDVAIWYPLRVIMMILGVPEEDEPRMLQLTQEMFGADDPELRRGAATPEERDAVTLDFMRYFTRMTADRRAHPGDDVATVIANARIDGEPIGDLEAISYYIILATAGHDTTSSSTAGGLLALLEHPEELRKVRDDPSVVAPAVEEAIRWVTPVKHFLRYATEDYELRGKLVREGDALMMLYPSANRDEEVFDEPSRFIADRRPNRHLAFGHGVHRCLGHLLAKMEMRYLYQELFRRVERMELIGEPRWAHSIFVGGLKSLPIRFAPK